MIKYFLIIMVMIGSCFTTNAELPKKNNKKGEYLKYVIHYGIIRGGKASLKLRLDRYQGKKVLHASLTGKTVGLFNTLYKVRDTYESFINAKTLLPVKAIRDINEGNYKRYNEITFDRVTDQVYSTRKDTTIAVPIGCHDILSAFYFARAHHFNNQLKEGEIIKINTFFAEENFVLRFRFMGYEKINSKIGKVNCYKFIPIVQTGRAFKDEDDMKIWISADANKVPVRVQFDLFIGSLRCDLTNFSNFSPKDLLNE